MGALRRLLYENRRPPGQYNFQAFSLCPLRSDGVQSQLAYGALIESIKAYSLEQLYLSAASLSPTQISSDTTYGHLFSVVQRTTHIAVSDLRFTEKASLYHPLDISNVAPEAVGVLLEWQIAAVEEKMWDPERRPVLNFLLQDVLQLYGIDFPIRRAR